MKYKKVFNLTFVALNLLALILLVDKTGSSESVYDTLPIKKEETAVLPASDETKTYELTVTKIIDGDTIELSDGTKVRYIGIDTAELGKNSQCFAEEAKKKNEELVLGKAVELEKDVSETDQYKRLLRYVYVGEAEDRIMINEELVRGGFAQVSTYPPDVKYKDKFLELQNKARNSDVGLWKMCK